MSIFSGMKIYTAHIKPGSAHAYETPLFVKEGFNSWAFLLTFIWALYRRLWWPAIGMFAVNMLVMWLGDGHGLDAGSAAILQLGVQVLIGYHANDWLRAKLARRGYLLVDITAGDSLIRAEQRYFERYLATA